MRLFFISNISHLVFFFPLSVQWISNNRVSFVILLAFHREPTARTRRVSVFISARATIDSNVSYPLRAAELILASSCKSNVLNGKVYKASLKKKKKNFKAERTSLWSATGSEAGYFSALFIIHAGILGLRASRRGYLVCLWLWRRTAPFRIWETSRSNWAGKYRRAWPGPLRTGQNH